MTVVGQIGSRVANRHRVGRISGKRACLFMVVYWGFIPAFAGTIPRASFGIVGSDSAAAVAVVAATSDRVSRNWWNPVGD